MNQIIVFEELARQTRLGRSLIDDLFYMYLFIFNHRESFHKNICNISKKKLLTPDLRSKESVVEQDISCERSVMVEMTTTVISAASITVCSA